MFEHLRRLRAFERKHFPCVQTPLDSVLIAEIGYQQERGHPLTIKGLLLLELGAPATVRRRMQRLVSLGLIHKRRVSHDRRLWQLEIDSALRMRYSKYLRLVSRL